MGGNIFKDITRRYNKNEYNELSNFIITKLKQLFPLTRISIIPSYKNKETFGDIDILIESNLNIYGEIDLINIIIENFNDRIYKNGNIYSFVYGLVKHDFQVDLILTQSKFYESSLNYFSYNDLGNLLGRLFHKFGLKYGYDGLSYPLRNGDYLYTTIPITTDITKILTFLQLEPNIFLNGFNNLEDIFEFVSSSCYFNPEIYLLQNRNHKSRIRDTKRKTYIEFLDWCEINYNNLSKYEWHSNDERKDYDNQNKSKYIDIIFKFFPEIEIQYNSAIAYLEISKKVKEKFNGDIIMRITGLIGKKLGKFMSYYKSTFKDDDQFIEYILNSNEIEFSKNVQDHSQKWIDNI